MSSAEGKDWSCHRARDQAAFEDEAVVYSRAVTGESVKAEISSLVRNGVYLEKKNVG